MAESGESKLPTAAYITFVEGAVLPAGKQAAELLEARLDEQSGLTRGEMTLGIGGAGLLVSFAHPTQTLSFARELVALAHSPTWGLPDLRIGIHVAAMSRPTAESREETISGSSIDGAIRIAGLAEPNQALATAQFQTVVVHLLKIGGGALTPLGKRTTASGKTLDVFEVAHAHAPPMVPPVPAEISSHALNAEVLAQIEQTLAAELGPIARILIKQASAHLPDQNRFLLQLADAITEPDKRREFLSRATKIAGGY